MYINEMYVCMYVCIYVYKRKKVWLVFMYAGENSFKYIRTDECDCVRGVMMMMSCQFILTPEDN